MTAAERVVAAWYAPRVTALAALLWPLSLPYRLIVALRRAAYRAGLLRAQRLPVPVIVVGNVTVGGSGKTPLVKALAENLARRGFHPGIVSRGYGGSESGPLAVAADDDPLRVGDEPPLHAAAGFPVWIGRDRPAAARALLAAHPQCDVLIADDGLQHYALARDMEIVAVDASRALGNGLMLPAGPLREPATRLAEADAVVRVTVPPAVPAPVVAGETLAPLVPLPWRNLRDAALVADPRGWRGAPVHALAGIGDPGRFFALLRSQGIAATTHPLPDHHRFVAADLDYPDAVAILMTEKDAVKCAHLADLRCWCLPVRAELDPALATHVEEKIRGCQTARTARLSGDQGSARVRP